MYCMYICVYYFYSVAETGFHNIKLNGPCKQMLEIKIKYNILAMPLNHLLFIVFKLFLFSFCMV